MSQHLTFAILLQLAEQYREIVSEYGIYPYPPTLTPGTVENARMNTMYHHFRINRDVQEALHDLVHTYTKYLGKLHAN